MEFDSTAAVLDMKKKTNIVMIIHPEDFDIEVVENWWPRRRHSTALELSPPPPESFSPPSPPLSEDFIGQIMLTND